MILLQILETRWSKRSRGAPLASLRNATPEALPLPGHALQPALAFCHRVRFDEEDRFEGKVIEEQALAALPKSRANVELRPSEVGSPPRSVVNEGARMERNARHRPAE